MLNNKDLNELLVDAICEKKPEIVAELLAHGANPNAVIDQDLLTPLHFSVVNNVMEISALLLIAGANPFQVNLEGVSSLDKAIMYNNQLFLKLLLKAFLN